MAEYVATLVETMEGSRAALLSQGCCCQLRGCWLASPFRSVARVLQRSQIRHHDGPALLTRRPPQRPAPKLFLISLRLPARRDEWYLVLRPPDDSLRYGSSWPTDQ